MTVTSRNDDHPALQLLVDGETVDVLAEGSEVSLLVTDRRIAVSTAAGVALDIGFDGLRRIQFDIERERPATLVVVPHNPANEPQVVPIAPDQFDEVTRALAIIGKRLLKLSN